MSDLVRRYITVPAVLSNDGELIPIWDERLVYSKNDHVGRQIMMDHDHYSTVTEGVYDLKKKTLSSGLQRDIYPKKLKFKEGDIVLHSVKGENRSYLVESEIVDVSFDEHDKMIVKGKEYLRYNHDDIDPTDVQNDTLICLRSWRPTYSLKDGFTTKWDHELFHITDQ